MRILILVAMDKELNLLLNILDYPHPMDNSQIIEGSIAGNQVFISKCGIGKVNAAIKTYELITLLNPDLVINSGVAGGAGVKVGTLLVPEKVAYHDVWCGPGTQYGQADNSPLFFSPDISLVNICKLRLDPSSSSFGLICSGDKFIHTVDEILYIKSKFPDVKAVDMESAAIAQVCERLNKRFIVVRVVSDTPGEADNLCQYKNFWTEAPQKTFECIRFILQEINEADYTKE